GRVAAVLESVAGRLRAITPPGTAPGAADIAVTGPGGTHLLEAAWFYEPEPAPGLLLARKYLESGWRLMVELSWEPATLPVTVRARVLPDEPCSSRTVSTVA